MGTATNDIDEGHRRGAKRRWVGEVNGFNVHAGVTVKAGDRHRLEKLWREGGASG